MKVFAFALVLATLSVALANREICPHPEETGAEVVSEMIRMDPPVAGHTDFELDLSSKMTRSDLACFTFLSQVERGGPHIISLGKNRRGGFGVKVYTEERKGLDAFLQAYLIPQPGPNPTDGPGPHPTSAPGPNPNPGPGPNPTGQPFPSLPSF